MLRQSSSTTHQGSTPPLSSPGPRKPPGRASLQYSDRLLADDDLARATAEFLRRIRERFPERLFAPEPDPPRPGDGGRVHFPFREEFRWEGVEPGPYKSGGKLPYRDVARHEILRRGEGNLSFELRYFEVAPGGHTSLERHRHGHGIIAARGRGILTIEGERIELGPLDVARVPSMAEHQLRSADPEEPFGFFCIVDRDRDPPIE